MLEIQSADRAIFVLPILPAYAPILAPPSKLMNLDPGWKTCTQRQYFQFDPPKALTPVSALLPFTTTADPSTTQTPAAPSSVLQLLPEETSSTPTKSVPAAKTGDPPVDQAVTSQSDPASSTQLSTLLDPAYSSALTRTPDQPKSALAVGSTSNANDPGSAPDPVIIGGLTFAPVPKSQGTMTAPAVIVQGQTLVENGPSAMIEGSTVMYSAGSIYVGNLVAPVPSSASQRPHLASNPQGTDGVNSAPTPAAGAHPDTSPTTVNTPNASPGGISAVMYGTHKILPYDPPTTVLGTRISLGSTGLAVGTMTYALPSIPIASGSPLIAIFDGQSLQVKPGAPITVDGSTHSAAEQPPSPPPSSSLASLGQGASVTPSPTTNQGVGLGKIILMGLGPVGPTSTLAPTSTSTAANSGVSVEYFTASKANVHAVCSVQVLVAAVFLVVFGM